MIVNPDPATLGPDASRMIWFTVTVPPGGDLMVNHLTITATAQISCSDSTDPAAAHTFVINQDPGLTLVQNESETALPGETVTYEHLLTNAGNYTDNTILLTWHVDPAWPVTVNEGAVQPLAITLAQDETMTITVDVTIPEEATCGMFNTTIITATSYAGEYKSQIVSAGVTDSTSVETAQGVEFGPDRIGNATSDPSQPVTISYTHRLTNTGNCQQIFEFDYHSSLGWTVAAPSPVTLDPGDAENVTVYVTIPPTTTNDLLVDTTVITAYHQGHYSDWPKEAVVDTTVVNQSAGVGLAPDNTGVVTQPASASVRVLYTHTLTNSGNYTDTFDLTWLNESGWRVDVNGQTSQPAEVTVGSNHTAMITVEVTVPSWIYTMTNHMVITAGSQFRPTVMASAANTTTLRRPHVTLEPNYTQNVAPGSVITHVHTLTNTGGVSDSYDITYHSSLGWAVVVPTTVYTVPPGGTALVTATISVPAGTDILSGTVDRLVITATSQITNVVHDSAVDLTTVPYAPAAALTPTPYNGQGQAGVPIPYTHTLTNLGNYTESFHLQVWSEFANGSVSPEWVYNLGPGEAYTPVVVTVLLPTHAAAGETEETQVLVSFAGERIAAHDYTLVIATSGTRYVAPEGTNDNNSCLVPYEYGPCATVQQAVNQALAGDQVHVAQGVYTDIQATGEYTQAVYLDKDVTLLGGYINGDWSATPDPATNQTVLDAGGQGRVIYVVTGVTSTIAGFHLRQGYVAGDGAGLYVTAGAVPTVRRNLIYSNTATGSGSEGGGVYYHYTGGDSDFILERNTFYSNTAEIGGGLYLYGSYGPGVEQRLWNNVFYRNTANAGGGLYIAGDSVMVWNSTFYNNTATNGGGVYFAASSSAISNTILSNNSGYGIYKDTGLGGTPKLDYNLVWANSPANSYGVALGGNTITATPSFVDTADDDLHLRSDSPAIDGGDPGGTLPGVDLDGNPRPLPASGRHDIGAYENGLTSGKKATEYVPPGGIVTYTIAVTNSGTAPRNVAITDRLHNYLEYVSLSSTPPGSSDYGDHTVSWHGTVYSETTALITITATITDWLMAGTPITNVAQINYVSGSMVTTVVTGTPGARHVTEIGDNTGNNCLRPDLPCRTIQYAVVQALANDEVRVASGVYTGTDQVAYVSKPLTLTGGYTPTLPTWTYAPNAYTTTLDAQGGQGMVITGSVAGTVNGLHIVNGSEGVAVYAATAIISRCRIYNSGDGVHVTGGDLTMVRSWVYDNNDDGVDVNAGAYTLINNVIAHNAGAGVRATGSSSGSLLHNTLARNATAGAIVNNTAHFTNTIFYSHTVGLSVATGSAYLSNTLWYSNTANFGTIISSTNLFDADPRFEDPDGMDYHIQPGSSVIDQGLDTGLGEDVDGDHRPLLQHPDLGADEFALEIVKHAPATANPGQVITYSIKLQGGESGLVLTDTLDAHLTYTGTVICPGAGSCGYLAAQRAVTWTGDLPGMQPAYITYTAQVTTWLAPGTRILNDAQVLISGDVHNTNEVATTINAVSGTRYVDAVTGVDTDGDIGNNCLARWKPCATLQHAVDQAQASDTIKVAAGDYTGTGQVVSIAKSLTLSGGYTTADWDASDPGAHATYLDGQGSGRVIAITGPATVTIDGFHLLNGSISGDGGGLYVNEATVVLANSQVYNNAVSGRGGGIYHDSGDLTLTNSRVYSNTAGGSGGGLYLSDAGATLTDNRIYTNTSGSYGGGLHTLNGPAVLMERNVILDNQAAHGGGASVTSTVRITMANNIIGSNHASLSGGGLLFDGSGTGLLRHNTIANNGGAGVQVGNFSLGLTNTILSGHTVGMTTTAGANVTTDYTLLDGNGTDYDDSAGGVISNSNDATGPPNYRDQAALDYHITGSSAAIGAGIEVGVDTDIDGESRAVPPDIGADQYNLRTDRWASSTELAPCQTVIHTLVLTNVAGSLIPGVVLTDALPAEVTYTSGSITHTSGSGGYLVGSQAITWTGDVAAHSSTYITYTVNVNSYPADGTIITFTASISDPISTFPGNPLIATVHTITATTHKEGRGGVSPAGQATIGEIVTYTVVYTVPGGHETHDPVVVDLLPRLVENGTVVSTTPALVYVPGSLSITNATTQTEEISPDGGVITWTLNSVTAACGVPTVATLTFNARVLALADNTDGDTLTDTLTISYADGASDRVIGDEQVLALVEPGLTLAHTAATTQNLGMGDSVVITLTITNPGNATLYDTVLTDTLGSGWVVDGTTSAVFTHTLGGIDAGNSVPVTFTARVDDGMGPAATLAATAEAVGSSLPGNEPDERVYVAAEPLTATTGSLDLEVSKEGPPVRSSHQRILYTIGYTNTGVVRAEGVQIADTLPFSLTDIISATSASATVEHVGQAITWTLTAPVSRSVSGRIWITATVAAAAEEGSVLTNTVTITTTRVESDTTNNSDATYTTVRLPSLHITKTATTPYTRQLLTYTFTISNTGLGNGTNLLITDTVPSSTTYHSCSGAACGLESGSGVVTWTLPALPAGEQAGVTLTVRVDSDVYSGTTLLNHAYGVTCIQSVEDVGAPLASTVAMWRELSLQPTSQHEDIQPEGKAVYTHTLTNLGNATGTFSLTVSGPPAGWTYDLQPPGWVTDLAPDRSAVITLTVTALASASNEAQATVTATWQGYAESATAVDTTTIGNYMIYLPLVLRNYR